MYMMSALQKFRNVYVLFQYIMHYTVFGRLSTALKLTVVYATDGSGVILILCGFVVFTTSLFVLSLALLVVLVFFH